MCNTGNGGRTRERGGERGGGVENEANQSNERETMYERKGERGMQYE